MGCDEATRFAHAHIPWLHRFLLCPGKTAPHMIKRGENRWPEEKSRAKKLSGADPREPQPVPTLAMSIPQFYTAHNISEGFYYKLKKQKLNPREMKIGIRTLITFEAAAEWRAEREAASTASLENARAKREQAA